MIAGLLFWTTQVLHYHHLSLPGHLTFPLLSLAEFLSPSPLHSSVTVSHLLLLMLS